MATHNSYLAYKQDTTKLLRWIIQSSNSIIKSTVPLEDDNPETINTTGQISVSDFVSSSKLIGKHISPVPSAVYRLLQSVLEARTTTYYLFQQLVTNKPDPEIERTNASHKVFIDSLTKAFEYLGGDEWMSNLETEPNKLDEEDDLEPGIFAERLKTLNINKSREDVEGGEDSSDNDDQPFLPHPSPQKRRQTKRSGKSQKGKRGNKARKKQRKEAEEPVLDDVPLESYRIIQDDDGVRAEYLMAVYALLEQWSVLRSYIQSVWYDVAYEGLNSAVAGTMSNIAISMVKRMESAIFADFPDHNSYEAIMNTITRGDSEKVQGLFSMSLYKQIPDSSDFERIHDTPVDILEQFSIHAYRDLNDFVTDFQKTRSGKPTKRMLSQIRSWDPNFNIHNASKEERINWRRSYTINWLYDLVNVFSSAVVQHNNIHDVKCAYEEVDWTINGPWNKYRRLYGLNEFAGAITSLAMQKHSTDIRHKILPHLVFQLQCIVDSMTVSRGWSLDGIRGHVLNQAAHEFCPTRDVNIFLDRRCERAGSGFIQAVNILKAVFERDSTLYAEPRRHKAHREFLEGVTEGLCNSLGESKCIQESTIMSSSRFSNTCSNGLWEYSPFLCGFGLMEALEIAYSVSMTMWEGLPEPMMAVHLYNMLLRRGYLPKAIGLYDALLRFFPKSFFPNGKTPTSNFGSAFHARLSGTGARQDAFQQRASARDATRATGDIHSLLNQKNNNFFRTQSQLILYRHADWDPDKISDSEVPLASGLCTLRIGGTKHVLDSETGERRLENTDLVHRARAKGIEENSLLEMSGILRQMTAAGGIAKEAFVPFLPEGHTIFQSERRARKFAHPSGNFGGIQVPENQLLALLKLDIVQDVCGHVPLSATNYISATTHFMVLFLFIEDELNKLGNASYLQAYDDIGQSTTERRLSLTTLALNGQDEECLRAMAAVFQNHGSNFTSHIYWDELDGLEMKNRVGRGLDGDGQPRCAVM